MKKRNPLFSQSLIKLGLSPHEARVYQALFKEGNLSAKEVAKRIGVLSSAVYRLLEKLAEKGFVSTTGRYPKVYRAISPSIALDFFTKRRILATEALKSQAIKELSQKKTKIRETEINLITSRYEIFMSYAEMAKGAKEEILIISIGEPIPDEALLANRDALEKEVKIYMIAHKHDKENQDLLKSWQKMGMEIRYYPDWGFHIIVFDSKKSLLAVNNPKNPRERIGMQIFSSGLSKALRDYFYFVWEKAAKV